MTDTIIVGEGAETSHTHKCMEPDDGDLCASRGYCKCECGATQGDPDERWSIPASPKQRFALPPLADSREAMEGIGPNGEIPAPSSLPAVPANLKEAIDNLVRCQATVLRLDYRGKFGMLPYEKASEELSAARSHLENLFLEQQREIERLRRFETYVCQVIAMGTQADLTVESLPR